MLPISAHKSLLAWSLLLSLTGCSLSGGVGVVRPPAPEKLSAIPLPIAPSRDSVISVPIRIDLSTFLDAAKDENLIPKKFDHWGSYLKTPKGAAYKYYAERDDFAIDLSGSHQSISTDQGTPLRNWWKGIDLPGSSLSTSAALRYKIGTDPHGAQCGEGSEWPRRATLNGGIAVGLTPDYSLSASVHSVTVNTIDSCKLHVADSDVSQEVHSRLTDVVTGGLTRAVASLNTMTVKPHVEDAWSALRNPIQLEPDTWLLLNIDKIRHSGLSAAGPIVDDTIQVMAKPVIVFGSEPPAASAALPQLDTQPAATGFHVVADTRIEYDTLSKVLATRLKGARFDRGGDNIRITNASVYGNGDNQLVIRIDFTGDALGHAYFIGKPEINALTQTMHISGVRYDSATEKLLLKNAAWIYRSEFREFIANQAFLGVTPAIDRLRNLLTTGLNRSVNPAISMHGTVASVQGIGVFADTNALYVRVMSDGTLSLKLADKH
ncbi:MAG: DUF4403 family protein [Nitrospira sp.]|nr:DUF4403 family protein [Nitrospira sp.]MBH0182438.1 DUF4403 family protein [Nitrospira sp.]